MSLCVTAVSVWFLQQFLLSWKHSLLFLNSLTGFHCAPLTTASLWKRKEKRMMIVLLPGHTKELGVEEGCWWCNINRERNIYKNIYIYLLGYCPKPELVLSLLWIKMSGMPSFSILRVSMCNDVQLFFGMGGIRLHLSVCLVSRLE